ncbi:hypothetical protein [Halalkalibacterium ligniniphilum]
MDQAHLQLELLQRLMQIFQNEDTVQFLASEEAQTKI